MIIFEHIDSIKQHLIRLGCSNIFINLKYATESSTWVVNISFKSPNLDTSVSFCAYSGQYLLSGLAKIDYIFSTSQILNLDAFCIKDS